MTFRDDEQLAKVVRVPPGEGEVLEAGASDDYMHLKAAGEDTEGCFALLEYYARPRSKGAIPHWHDGHEEGFYVLEGELEMLVGDETVVAEPGEFILVPRRVVHAFANRTDRPARFMATFSPAGFEKWFVARREVVKSHPPGSPGFAEAAVAWGMHHAMPTTGEERTSSAETG